MSGSWNRRDTGHRVYHTAPNGTLDECVVWFGAAVLVRIDLSPMFWPQQNGAAAVDHRDLGLLRWRLAHGGQRIAIGEHHSGTAQPPPPLQGIDRCQIRQLQDNTRRRRFVPRGMGCAVQRIPPRQTKQSDMQCLMSRLKRCFPHPEAEAEWSEIDARYIPIHPQLNIVGRPPPRGCHKEAHLFFFFTMASSL